MTVRAIKADQRAVEVARAIHRPDSDIDVLIIKDPSPPEEWLDRIITGLIPQHRIIPDDAAMPGEEHRYLTEFGGAALYSHEHLPLDKESITRDVPDAIAALRALVE